MGLRFFYLPEGGPMYENLSTLPNAQNWFTYFNLLRKNFLLFKKMKYYSLYGNQFNQISVYNHNEKNVVLM